MIETLLIVILKLVVIGLIFYLFWWLIGYIGLPEPIGKVVNVLLAVVLVIFLILILLNIFGGLNIGRL